MERFEVLPFIVRVACCFCCSLIVPGIKVKVGEYEVRLRTLVVKSD